MLPTVREDSPQLHRLPRLDPRPLSRSRSRDLLRVMAVRRRAPTGGSNVPFDTPSGIRTPTLGSCRGAAAGRYARTPVPACSLPRRHRRRLFRLPTPRRDERSSFPRRRAGHRGAAHVTPSSRRAANTPRCGAGFRRPDVLLEVLRSKGATRSCLRSTPVAGHSGGVVRRAGASTIGASASASWRTAASNSSRRWSSPRSCSATSRLPPTADSTTRAIPADAR